MKHIDRNLFFYLLPFLVLLAACSGREGEKKLYPTKVVIGGTMHKFHYNEGRIYSVTTTRLGFYEEVTYRYYDEYFKEPEHRFKDKIFEIDYNPDNGPIGWDDSDSVKFRQDMLMRSDAGLIADEAQDVYLANTTQRDNIKHKYNGNHQLSESIYYFYDPSKWSKMQLNDERYIAKRVKYGYVQGKLAKVAYYGPGSGKPYLLIELSYDDKPSYLSSLPLEARFMALELPYRDHNIVSYIVRDSRGKIRKSLSYTCSYTYNTHGYPISFTRKIMDGKELSGSIMYKETVGEQ